MRGQKQTGLMRMIVVVACLTTPCLAGSVMYVDNDAPEGGDGTSWATTHKYLQDALAIAGAGDEIWVAQGAYRPDQGANQNPGHRGQSFKMLAGVAIYGGFVGNETQREQRDWEVNQTILSGDLNANDTAVEDPRDLINEPTRADNSQTIVVAGYGFTGGAILDGFTITGAIRSGMCNYYQSTVTVQNCTFRQNSADVGGGMYNQNASPRLINCAFNENAASSGGGMYNARLNSGDSSNPVLINCTFSNNSGNYGGGMYNEGSSSPTLANCTFSDNLAYQGGGMYNDENSSPVLNNCTFRKNSAEANHGGGMYNDENSSPVLSNCLFADNSASQYGGGIYARSSGALFIVTNCRFTRNSAGFAGGAMYWQRSNPTLTNCMFAGNSASSIYNRYYSSPTLTNCTFSNNSGWGMVNDCSCSPTLTNCTFNGNFAASGGGAIKCLEGSSPTLTNCILWGNGDGIAGSIATVEYSCVRHGHVGDGNISRNPRFVDPDGPDDIPGTLDDDLRLQADSPCNNRGSDADIPADVADLDEDGDTREPTSLDLAGNSRLVGVVDMGAYEHSDPTPSVVSTRLYVDDDASPGGDGQSWSTALLHLQDALELADSGTEIWTAAGTYYPDRTDENPTGTANRGFSFWLANGVVLYGGFAGMETAIDQRPTDPNPFRVDPASDSILSGDIGEFGDNSDNSRSVVRSKFAGPTATINGFTIISGNGVNHGGGMYNQYSSPTILNCTFTGNSATREQVGGEYPGAGGGMYNEYSNPTVASCTFNENMGVSAGAGGMFNRYSSPTVVNCTFTRNSVTSEYADASDGGGMYNEHSNTTITNCTFTGNSAKNNGGAIANWNNSELTATGCMFSGNSAVFGGGIFNYDDTMVTAINCTFSGNSAVFGSSLAQNSVKSRSSQLTMANCLLREGGNEIWTNSPPNVSINYSNIFGGWTGEGNIDADPLFVRIPNDGGDGWGDDPDTPDTDEGANDDFGDLRLQPSSPCIDAGENQAVPNDETDLDRDGDTSELIPFDRSGGLRFWDDPATPDTGHGDAPIVDMGAYEFQPDQLPGDWDNDGDVDLADLAGWAVCVTGPGNHAQGQCSTYDLDGDGDVDLADFGLLAGKF